MMLKGLPAVAGNSQRRGHDAPEPAEAHGSSAAANKPRAYSYVRFSTPEQAKGDSYRRQTVKAQAYARLHGLELDPMTFEDLGVSAFQNRNAKTGALRAFLRAVEEDDILPGSFLLVENLDRITRDAIIEAQGLFLQIIGGGINLVTLNDERVYSKEGINANPTDLIISIVAMMRGRDESVSKSIRMTSVYAKKREEAAARTKLDKPFTRMLPAWLRWDKERCEYVAIPERADVICDIFKRADAGWGQHRIAHWLNESGVEPWGAGERRAAHWHRSSP